MIRRPLISTLFPYTSLFRSRVIAMQHRISPRRALGNRGTPREAQSVCISAGGLSPGLPVALLPNALELKVPASHRSGSVATGRDCRNQFGEEGNGAEWIGP